MANANWSKLSKCASQMLCTWGAQIIIIQNIKDKLRDLNMSQNVTKEIVADIFGTRIGTHFESSLADAQSEALFKKSLERR